MTHRTWLAMVLVAFGMTTAVAQAENTPKPKATDAVDQALLPDYCKKGVYKGPECGAQFTSASKPAPALPTPITRQMEPVSGDQPARASVIEEEYPVALELSLDVWPKSIHERKRWWKKMSRSDDPKSTAFRGSILDACTLEVAANRVTSAQCTEAQRLYDSGACTERKLPDGLVGDVAFTYGEGHAHQGKHGMVFDAETRLDNPPTRDVDYCDLGDGLAFAVVKKTGCANVVFMHYTPKRTACVAKPRQVVNIFRDWEIPKDLRKKLYGLASSEKDYNFKRWGGDPRQGDPRDRGAPKAGSAGVGAIVRADYSQARSQEPTRLRVRLYKTVGNPKVRQESRKGELWRDLGVVSVTGSLVLPITSLEYRNAVIRVEPIERSAFSYPNFGFAVESYAWERNDACPQEDNINLFLKKSSVATATP